MFILVCNWYMVYLQLLIMILNVCHESIPKKGQRFYKGLQRWRPIYSISNIEEYNESDDWVVYEEMLDQYFVANRIEDVRRVPILSVIGTES